MPTKSVTFVEKTRYFECHVEASQNFVKEHMKEKTILLYFGVWCHKLPPATVIGTQCCTNSIRPCLEQLPWIEWELSILKHEPLTNVIL